MAIVFFSYSHADESLRDQLEKHLSLLKRQGHVEAWHDRRILAGDELDPAINDNLESADVILLLVSADFIGSDYCYSKEMRRALERHNAREACVVPVILRPCDWHSAPFGKLKATPRDGKAITTWANTDEAFTDVVCQVRIAVEAMNARACNVVSGLGAGSVPAAVTPKHSNAIPAAASQMSGHYIIRKSSAVQPYHFVLRAGNNEVILTSENYASKQGAQNGIASCQVNNPIDDRYVRKESSASQPYSFVLKAANGEVIGRSENYASTTGRDNGIASVKANGPNNDIRDDT